MNNEKLNILMLEDDPNDAALLQMFLKKALKEINTTLVSGKEDYIRELEADGYDVILSDHNLPQFSSLEALQIRNERRIDIPFILVSGAIPEEYAVALLQEGANDYILKDRPQRLPAAIQESIRKQKIIADKIRTEQELKKAYERLKLVGKATNDAIYDWDIINNEISWGDGFSVLFGYDISEAPKSFDYWAQFLHPEERERVEAGLSDIFNDRSKNNWVDEYRYMRADGSYAFVMSKGIILRNEKGNAIRMVGAVQDITHVRNLERQLLEEKLSRQEEIIEMTLKAEEKERTEIGKELHDNVNQLLATAKMMVEKAVKTPEMHDLCINKGLEAINMAITEVRNISHAMITPAVAHGEFVTAVKDLLENLILSGKLDASLGIKNESKLEQVSDKIKITAYRIIQEQVNNVLKHADASQLEVELILDDDYFQMHIIDNGKGFDPSKHRNGIGLDNIRSRAELNNGKVEIDSAPGKGCKMKVKFEFA